MSLRIGSSASADDLHERQALALFGGELGVERQLRHADDAVHRRPDLVAHVGEELALRRVGVLGAILRLREIGCSACWSSAVRARHLLFEMVLVPPQLLVAVLDLREHVVEAVDQRPDLVVLTFHGADVESLLRA